MKQRRSDLGAHALAKRQLSDRLIEELLEPEHRDEFVARPLVRRALDTVDVAQQIESVDDGKIPPQLRALSEHDADALDVPNPIGVRHEPADFHAAAVGAQNPGRILIVVDLPAPFGPMNPSSSPASRLNDTSMSASIVRRRR